METQELRHAIDINVVSDFFWYASLVQSLVASITEVVRFQINIVGDLVVEFIGTNKTVNK